MKLGILAVLAAMLCGCSATSNLSSSALSTTSYTVTPSSDGNETVSPASAATVSSGSTESFTVTANSGYTVGTVGGTCATGTWSGSIYTTGAITSNCTVSFTAVLSTTTYTVTPSGDGNETYTPSTAQTVYVGHTQAFTVTANSGFTLSTSVGGTCPSGSWSGSVYTTGAITANCTVTFATSTRLLTSFTSSTGTSTTSYFMSPPTNQVGSAACNGDYHTAGTNCTTYTATCSQVTEATSSCQSAREALGLTGNWLLFSCNVVEGLAYKSGSTYVATTTYADATYVSLTSQDFPTYSSNYYSSSGTYSFSANSYTVSGNYSSLHTSSSTAFPDPGVIAAPSGTITMYVPITPDPCTGAGCSGGSGSSNVMGMGAVGMAINGVYIYSGEAAGTDNIFAEAGSFDACGGHPAGSQYHYHNEPISISSNDDNLIGVMMDGYWIYGRQDADGTTPGTVLGEEQGGTGTVTSPDSSSANTIYFFGGHVGDLPNNTSTSQFHYHATEWVGCYDETANTTSGYYYTDNGVTFDTFNSTNMRNDTNNGAPASPASGGNTYCAGTWVDGWFLTGHGNGGVFETPSSIKTTGGTGSESAPVWTTDTSTLSSSTSVTAASPSSCGGTAQSGGCMSQSTAAVRYYYGVPGSCPSCN